MCTEDVEGVAKEAQQNEFAERHKGLWSRALSRAISTGEFVRRSGWMYVYTLGVVLVSRCFCQEATPPRPFDRKILIGW